MGPKETLGTETVLAAIAEMRLSNADTVSVLGTVYAYVSGMARNNVEYVQAATTTGVSDEDWWGAQAPFLDKVLASGDYPNLARLSEGGAWDNPDGGFEFGLTCVLDGIQAQVQATSAARDLDQGQDRGEGRQADGGAGRDEDSRHAAATMDP